MVLCLHRPSGFSPPGAAAPDRLDDEASRLSAELDFVGQLRLIKEDLGDADTS
jgi:hypothetical protein